MPDDIDNPIDIRIRSAYVGRETMRRCYYCNEPKQDDAIVCEKCARELDERLGRSDGMTREEAIEILQLIRLGKHITNDEALSMAISALEQEPCDAISREAVLQAVSEGCFELRGVYGRCEELINSLPSVQPSRRKGHWNTYENYQGGIKETWYECSECKWSNALLIPRKYCPNCGVENERVEDDKRGIFKKSC